MKAGLYAYTPATMPRRTYLSIDIQRKHLLICMYTHMLSSHVYIYTLICLYTYKHVRLYAYIHMLSTCLVHAYSTCLYAHMPICLYAYMLACMPPQTYISYRYAQKAHAYMTIHTYAFHTRLYP